MGNSGVMGALGTVERYEHGELLKHVGFKNKGSLGTCGTSEIENSENMGASGTGKLGKGGTWGAWRTLGI